MNILRKRISLEKDHTCYKNGLEEKMPASALFNKLARGQLLDGLNIITTTRPTAVPCIAHVNFDRTVEILGLRPKRLKTMSKSLHKEFATQRTKFGDTLSRT